MATVLLSKLMRNELYRAIVDAGLDPKDFDLRRDVEEDESASVTEIVHRESGSVCLIVHWSASYEWSARAGDEPTTSGLTTSWSDVTTKVHNWARLLRRWLDAPDLWAAVQQARDVLGSALYGPADDTAFTPDEQDQIAGVIRELKDLVRTYSLSEEKLRVIEAQLDDLQAAASRVTRKDWLLMFCGGVFAAFVAGVLPPEAVQEILRAALAQLDDLFPGGGPLQLPPLT
jgi:hypothetical protein